VQRKIILAEIKAGVLSKAKSWEKVVIEGALEIA